MPSVHILYVKHDLAALAHKSYEVYMYLYTKSIAFKFQTVWVNTKIAISSASVRDGSCPEWTITAAAANS